MVPAGVAQNLPFRVHDALRLGFIGYLFNYVAPGAVGGDLIKASMIAREQSERRLVAVATVFLDRVVGLIGLMVLGAVMMFFYTPVLDKPEFQYVIGVFQIGAVVSLAGMVVILLPGISKLPLLKRLVRLPKVGAIFAEFVNSIRLYQSRWRVLVLSLLMSLVSHAVLILAIYFCALALPGSEGIPSLLGHLQIIPPAELVGVIVPLPGGTGALEEAVAHFYKLAGASFDHGFLTAVAYRVVTIAISIVGANLVLRRPQGNRRGPARSGRRSGKKRLQNRRSCRGGRKRGGFVRGGCDSPFRRVTAPETQFVGVVRETIGAKQTRFRPLALAKYKASSATASKSDAVFACVGTVATPMLIVT